jgi:hypothetical protein
MLIETSRGHRDARHEEPIVLLNPDMPGDVCFQPPETAFNVEVTGIPGGVDRLTLFNGTGEQVAAMDVSDNGRAATRIEAADSRSPLPWRLHLAKQAGTIHIDGVTRWRRGDRNSNLSLWAPTPEAWFPLPDYRWLLTPYKRLVYGQPGESRQLNFRVHNNSAATVDIELALDVDQAPGWNPVLSETRVSLEPDQTRSVHLSWTTPPTGDQWTCRLHATPDNNTEFTTYSTVTARRGIAPAAEPISMPIVLKPYRHENAQFGYFPQYPTDNQVTFDTRNRPCVVGNEQIHILRNGAWKTVTLADALNGKPGRQTRARISKAAYDNDDGLYLIATVDSKPALLYSTDGGNTFDMTGIPGGGTFDIEDFTGHNVPDGPPPFIRITRTARDPNMKWRSLNDLELFVPEKRNGRISVGKPVKISGKCIGLSAHSGIPSSVVSRNGRIHVAWAEATEPEENAPGVPTFVITYDRASGTLGKPALIGYGPPANDVHNSPSITMDSKGYLHALIGTHGRTFKYARSLQPNTADGGWTEAEDIGPGLRQTYVGLVCDSQDTLHVVFRLWQNNPDIFPAGHYAALTHMSKRPDEPWSAPQPLVVAAFSEYSIFYHRLTVDRTGDLFLSYDYWSTFWFYRTDHVGSRRALLTSPDGGKTWKLAGNADLLP